MRILLAVLCLILASCAGAPPQPYQVEKLQPLPVALDNDFAIWQALGNNAWPAKYLFDAQGKLMKRWVGEGRYDEIEAEAAGGQPRGDGVCQDRRALLRRDHRGDLRRRRTTAAGHGHAGG